MTFRYTYSRTRWACALALGAGWALTGASCGGGENPGGGGGVAAGGSAGSVSGGGSAGTAGSDASLGGASGAGATGGGDAGTGGVAATGGAAGDSGPDAGDAPGGSGGGDATSDANPDGADAGESGDSMTDVEACVPQPCANDGVTCGELPDGCGGTAKCLHQCAAPDTCGAKSPNKCGCVEYTQAEADALCVGKCAVKNKCINNVFSCDGYAGACTLDGPYDVCDGQKTYQTSPTPTGNCLKCSRTLPYDDCSYNSGRPFGYTCGGWTTNGLQDYEETDVDCGGPKNQIRCAPGKKCLIDKDCDTQWFGVCQGAVPPNTYGTCLNSAGPKVGCTKVPVSGSSPGKACCVTSLTGWYPYSTSAAITYCASKGLNFIYQRGWSDGGMTTPPTTGCVASPIPNEYWCCPNDQFL